MPILPRHHRAAFLAASALTAAVALSGPAQAGDDEPSGLNYKAGALDLHLGVDAGLAYSGVKNDGHGTGRNSRTGERAGGRPWFAGFLAPKADAKLGKAHGRD